MSRASSKRYYKAYQDLGLLARSQPEEIRERRAASEQAKMDIMRSLGEPVGDPGASPLVDVMDVTTGGIFRREGLGLPGAQTWVGKGMPGIMQTDPAGITSAVKGTLQHQMVSRRLQEAEQFATQKGPMWDDLEKMTQLPILEGAAATARENVAELKKAARRGGSARRGAFQAIQQIRAQNEVNTARVQALNQARFALVRLGKEYEKDNLKFSQDWINGLPGLTEPHNEAMDNATELMMDKALPFLASSTASWVAGRKGYAQQQKAKTMKWITGAIGLLAGGIGAWAGGAGALGTAAAAAKGAAAGADDSFFGPPKSAMEEEPPLFSFTGESKTRSFLQPHAEDITKSGLRLMSNALLR
jgi:hypothetical protein